MTGLSKNRPQVNPLDLPPAASEAELTPEQQESARLRHQLAVEMGKNIGTEKDKRPEELVPPDEDNPDNILLHFVEDGFTALGRVWYRGQEIEFTPGSQAFNDTKDRNGDTWVTYTDEDQYNHYGKLYFRRGPWPGKSLKDIKKSDYQKFAPGPDEDELAKADAAERKRGRAAPAMPRT